MQKRWLEEDNEKISSCKDMRRSNTQKNKLFAFRLRKRNLTPCPAFKNGRIQFYKKPFFNTKPSQAWVCM